MQFKSTLLAILSGAALSAALAVDVLTVDVRITSEELKQPDWAVAQHPISALGVVTPIQDCGGTGTPVQLRIQNCDGEPPVSIQPNTDTLVEFDWIPSGSFTGGTLKIYAETSVGDVGLFDDTVSGVGGQLSMLGTPLRITNALSGQDIVMVKQVQDSQAQSLLCVKFAVQVN